MPPVHEIPRTLSQPGEIRREYEEERRKFDEQLRLEREQEEVASRLFIEKLSAIEATQAQMEETDEVIARQIQYLDSNSAVENALDAMREQLEKRTHVFSQYYKLAANGTSSVKNGDDDRCHHRLQYSPHTKPEKSKIVYDPKDVARCAKIVGQYNNSSPSTSATTTTTVCTRKIAMLKNVCRRSNSCKLAASSSSTGCSRPTRRRSCSPTTKCVGVDLEPDSITDEVTHFFRPIEESPVTPPKKSADGRSLLHPILLITPIKLAEISVVPPPTTIDVRPAPLTNKNRTTTAWTNIVDESKTKLDEKKHEKEVEKNNKEGNNSEQIAKCNVKKFKNQAKKSETVNIVEENDNPIAKRTRSATKRKEIIRDDAPDEDNDGRCEFATLSAERKKFSIRQTKPITRERAKRKLQFASVATCNFEAEETDNNCFRYNLRCRTNDGKVATPVKIFPNSAKRSRSTRSTSTENEPVEKYAKTELNNTGRNSSSRKKTSNQKIRTAKRYDLRKRR